MNETDIGSMNIVSHHCKALKWKGELAGLYFSSRKVQLDLILPLQEPLKLILNGEHPLSKQFLNGLWS